MENPGELIRRAREKRKYIHREAERESPPEEEKLPPMPPPLFRHSNYTALMRSHDRVHTRHVQNRFEG